VLVLKLPKIVTRDLPPSLNTKSIQRRGSPLHGEACNKRVINWCFLGAKSRQ